MRSRADACSREAGWKQNDCCVAYKTGCRQKLTMRELQDNLMGENFRTTWYHGESSDTGHTEGSTFRDSGL